MPKYRVLIPGRSYQCTACGAIHQGLNARNLAAACYQAHQDAESGPYNPLPYSHHDKAPGEGITRPDVHGHYRRVGPDSPDYNTVQYHQAFNRNSRRTERELAALDRLLGKPQVWKDKISPLQRLSYAYHYGGWESVKQAAYNLAYSEAIRQRLNEWLPDLLRQTLHLDRLAREVISDELAQDKLAARLDMQEFTRRIVDRLALDRQLNDILEGENETDRTDTG